MSLFAFQHVEQKPPRRKKHNVKNYGTNPTACKKHKKILTIQLQVCFLTQKTSKNILFVGEKEESEQKNMFNEIFFWRCYNNNGQLNVTGGRNWAITISLTSILGTLTADSHRSELFFKIIFSKICQKKTVRLKFCFRELMMHFAVSQI